MSAALPTSDMWRQACFLNRLVASSVRVSEAAGSVIKDIVKRGDLKVVDKSSGNGPHDLQTEADRAAQYCIENSLQDRFGGRLTIIGEEEKTSQVATHEVGFSDDVLEIGAGKTPQEFQKIVEEDVVIWVDPLDGTSEFAQAALNHSPLLQQITVLIGIAYKGKAIAGVIHQPYYKDNGRTVWGIVGMGAYGIDYTRDDSTRVVVTTRSHSTKMVQELLTHLESVHLLNRVERVGGAGFKVLRCMEDAAAYVFPSGGCKKWDTAAPEALLVAAGGKLTDISGRTIYYGKDAQLANSGGVLATASWINHQEYLDAIPQQVKDSLPEKTK